MMNVNDITEFNQTIGTEEIVTLKPEVVKVRDVKIVSVGVKQNKKVVFFVKHTKKDEPIEISSIKWISPKNLGIQLKGYKEYTFAIRQSGTDAPVLYLIKDDFGVTPLVATYISAGRYTCDVTELGITTASNKCSIWVSKANPYDASDAHEVTAVLKTDTLFIVYSIVNNVLSDDVIGAAGSGECVTISIRETLEDT